MEETYIRLEGKIPGGTSLLLVGTHGDERCGIEAIEHLLPKLNIQKGTVLIEYGNPRAIEQNIRYTEANLNRMFKPDSQLTSQEKESYEYARAQYLKALMHEAEVLLDIHASFTPESKPFLICEPNAFEIAAQLPFDTVVSGFDMVEPGGTDYYMNSNGKIGLTAECGYLGNISTTDYAIETILRFLEARDHISSVEKDVAISLQEHINMHALYLTKTEAFKLGRPFADFEHISKGTLIGIDGEVPITAQEDSIILFARDRERVGEEAFLLGTKTTE